MPEPRPAARRFVWVLIAAIGLAALAALVVVGCNRRTPEDRGAPSPGSPAGLDEAVLRERCSACHLFAEPATMPRWAWRPEVEDMYRILDLSEDLPVDKVVAWYEDRAPAGFPLAASDPGLDAGGLRFVARSFAPEGTYRSQAVSNVRLVDVVGDERLELLACDMANGLVLVGFPYREGGRLQVIGRSPHPAHAEVVDLDRDGRRDLLVADLGSFPPADHAKGSVVWLRSLGDLRFQRLTLRSGLARVVDVEPADFDGDGDLDLAVAEFGWRTTGSVLVLENRTRQWERPDFEPRPIDSRHGGIHVPVADLNGDGRPDFLALISQEHEVIVAYLNQGGFRFEPREIHRAPGPTWGFSGLSLADLDRDGDLDLLATNGDSLDFGGPKPYHGIQWFENRGDLRFEPRDLWPMMGAHRAEATDLDGDGDLDIVASAFVFIPPHQRGSGITMDSIIWLEQTDPGRFARHVLESLPLPDHATLAVGDYDRDGDGDFAAGIFNWPGAGPPRPEWVVLRENRLRR